MQEKVTLLLYNPATGKYDIPREVKLARPDQYGVRGGPICAVCGGHTVTVLDGEAWCPTCKDYQ
ncbi:hypothetical protein MGLY_28260 [Neomoorella glycerini]|uniref:Uncharacterized protein n=1 Tax=Neomoorella glycerini TaxID=55779 RepID=A0A6I5ZUM6_9FIRM|nr:hypothetical protein [Moorella glycerini]QGP93418.1 hypothetical protein MGLY_28260 [Moorella glycerini]